MANGSLLPLCPYLFALCPLPSALSAQLFALTALPFAFLLVQRELLQHPAFGISQRLNHNECICINVTCCSLDPANLQPRHHTEQYVLLHIGHTPAAFVHGDATLKAAHNGPADLFVTFRDDGDSGKLFNSVNQEVDGFRRCKIGEHRIKRRLDPQKECGCTKDKNIQQQDYVTYSQNVTTLADQKRCDLGAVENRPSPNRESDAGSNKEPAEHSG